MEYIFLAVDTLVVSGLYWLYKNKTKNLENVKVCRWMLTQL